MKPGRQHAAPRRRIRRVFAALLLAMLAGRAAAAEPLQPPSGYRNAVGSKHSDAVICDASPEPFTGTLEFPSKYEGSGAARDQLNVEAEAAYKLKTRPITSMEKGVVALVKKTMRSGKPEALKCTLGWLTRWAEAGALLGEAKNHTGRSLRKWSLGSLASAYLRLKFSSSAPLKNYPEESQRIEAWFSAIADHVVIEWPASDPIEKINNHYYWAAWALMAASVATDRRDLFDHAVTLYRVFSQQVDAEGYLPNELKRASRAAGYHNYAMAPVAMIAAFGKANGVDLAGENDHALTRLAQRAEIALNDPARFETKTGVAQDGNGLDSKSSRAWLEPYCWTVTCTADERAMRESSRPLASTRLGGELTAVFATTAASAHEEGP